MQVPALLNAAFLFRLRSSAALLSSGVFIGARPGAGQSANATISQAWLLGATLPCSPEVLSGLPGVAVPAQGAMSALRKLLMAATTTAPLAAQPPPPLVLQLAAAAAANSPPEIAAVEQWPAGDVFVGDAVQLTASALDANPGDALR